MTILFEKDWKNESGQLVAIPHLSTKNKSFIKISQVLKRMGIKNFLFPLALYDMSLKDIDPHSLNQNNDPDGLIRVRVSIEAKKNLWYYLREIVRIPADGGDSIPYILNRSNLAMSWCYLCNIDYNSTQPRQTGKEAPLDSLIKVPGGWKRMGDMQVGDQAIAVDGSVTNVIGVYPQGVKDIYKVTFDDGRSTRCGLEHLWKCYTDQWSIKTTSNIISLLKEFQCVSIPVCSSEQSPDKNLPYEPYKYGQNLAYDPSLYKQEIFELYKEGSTSQRRSLVQGFLDSEGLVNKDGRIWFLTENILLARDIQYIIRSLGGLARIDKRIGRYYEVDIQIKHPNELFRSSKHFAHLDSNITEKETLLAIKSIEYVGKEEAQCIEINHPEHLYITDDFIVTHNTIGAIALTSWVIYVSGYNMKIAMVTHSQDLVTANVKRLKDMRDSLPSFLHHKSTNDIDNKEGLDYKALHNEYQTYIGQKDRKAANRVGRGSTSPSIHFDELPFIPNVDITFPAIMAATNRARQNAQRMNQVHSNLYTTTAGDPTTIEGKFTYEKIISNAMPFTERLYDCIDKADAHAMVARHSINKLVNGTFSHLQLGISNKEFHEMIIRNSVPPDEIERDYYNNWVSLAKNPIISKDLLQKMALYRRNEPLFTEIISDYVVSWYVPRHIADSFEFKRKPLILGCDASEMVGRDFTTFVCVDPSDLSVVLTFRCNDSNTVKIGLLVAALMTRFSRMIFAPERKSVGITIIDMLVTYLERENDNPYKRIFNHIVDNYDLQEFKQYDINDRSLYNTTARKYLGFMTTGSSREVLYKLVLQRAVTLGAERIYDPVLIMELSGLQATSGRIDHHSKEHDDMVIAYLIACYVILFGKNLHMYEISQNEILNSQSITHNSKSNPIYMSAQLELRKKIKDLHNQAMSENVPYLKQHLLYKVKQLEEHIDFDIQLDPVSLDSVKHDIHKFGNVYQNQIETFPKRYNISPTQIFSALSGNFSQ